jgi:RNA polymerase sigma factor (sigma-70 family)
MRTEALMEANEIVERLVSSHRDFLGYLQAKVGNKALAEDILHEAFVRGLEKADTVREGDSATAWFYRVLRNAVVDHARRNAAASRKLEAFARELETTDEEEGAMREVCQCVSRLASTLKPEYAEAVRRIEVEGMSVKDFAAALGISAGNAGVRIFRAREALRKQVMLSCGTCAEHGCVDCTCGTKTETSTETTGSEPGGCCKS